MSAAIAISGLVLPGSVRAAEGSDSSCSTEGTSPVTHDDLARVADRTIGTPSELPLDVTIVGHTGTVSTFTDGDVSQLVGTLDPTGAETVVEYVHRIGCDEPELTVETAEGGFAIFAESVSYNVGEPWAVDAAGEDLETYFEVRGGRLVQVIDTSSAKGEVIFDPTYTSMSCSNGYYSNFAASTYLDMYGANTDYGYCPVRRIFFNRNGYFPVYGFETNVANDYGRIALRQDGGCSNSPDTGWAWDFQVPCKAHDYCYDLRKAGFSGTVTDSNCDSAFYWIMEAHCNNRVFSGDCRIIRNTYYDAVRLPGVVTDPDPAAVPLRVLHSSSAPTSPAGMGALECRSRSTAATAQHIRSSNLSQLEAASSTSSHSMRRHDAHAKPRTQKSNKVPAGTTQRGSSESRDLSTKTTTQSA